MFIKMTEGTFLHAMLVIFQTLVTKEEQSVQSVLIPVCTEEKKYVKRHKCLTSCTVRTLIWKGR